MFNNYVFLHKDIYIYVFIHKRFKIYLHGNKNVLHSLSANVRNCLYLLADVLLNIMEKSYHHKYFNYIKLNAVIN